VSSAEEPAVTLHGWDHSLDLTTIDIAVKNFWWSFFNI